MIYLNDILAGVKAKIAADTFLNSQLNGQVTFGIVPQQTGSSQTVKPYLVLYAVGQEADGAFGNTFLDIVTLQFTVFSATFAITSDIVATLAVLFNASTITPGRNTMVEIHRNGSIRGAVPGQDKNGNFVYQGSVDIDFWTAGS